jgi:hypothetical protein
MHALTNQELSHLIIQLEKVRTISSCCLTSNPNEERKWSDVVAGRNPHASGTNTPAIHNIETVITSGPSHLRIGTKGVDTNKNIQPTSVKKGKKKLLISKPRIVVVGDSHARGVAGEILHQSNRHIKPTGYVKPNTGLSELISTVKNVSSKLTRRDTLIMIGGSNDIDTNIHSQNLTSMVNLLQDTQNTNLILAEVPVRYDVGARIHINEEIESYNRKLQKVTKEFQHVSLIKVTPNREQFTKHGLHLNSKGKELFSKELLKILAVKLKNQKAAAIQLPWKDEPSTRGAQNNVMKDFSSVQTNPSLSTLPSHDQEISNTCGHSMEPAVVAIKESTSD